MNDLIVDYVAGIPMTQLVEKYKTSRVTLSKRLRFANIPIRRREVKYPLRRDNYLDEIDTEEKAYFVGLIAADGNIMGTKVRISLQEEDAYILRFYSQQILGADAIRIKPPGKRSKKHSAWLYICSKQIANRFREIDITEEKSLTCHPLIKNWNDNLFKAFFLGLFDGDGAIYLLKRPNRNDGICFALATSQTFCRELNKRIKNITGINLHVSDKKCINGSISYLRTQNQKDIEKLMNWLYDIETPFLQRKYQVFKKFYS